jgi:RHS repeat-associated protein
MGARRYEPDDGRFLQQDFFRDANNELALSTDAPNANRYGFAAGNPVTFVDADGHVRVPDGGAGGSPRLQRLRKPWHISAKGIHCRCNRTR